jgi:hypothetical protein
VALTPITLAKGSGKGRYPQLGQTKLTNCYVEETPNGKNPNAIVAINGLIEWGSFPGNDGGVRAMLALDTELLTVSARQLFRNNAAGGPAELVGGIPADGIVTMAANRNSPRDVAIVVSGVYFLYEEGGTVVAGADPDLPSPIAVVEVNGYFVFLIEDGRFFIAGPDDTAVDGLDFASAESNADKNVMGATRGRELVIFGERSAEFWVDSGAADFPFARVQAIDVGCYAPESVANVLTLRGGSAATDTLMWAATDHKGAYASVVMLDGYSAVAVSDHEIDRLVRDEPVRANIRAFSWVEDGHSFYAISGSNFTKVLDTKSMEWHDRKTFGSARWRPAEHAAFAGMNLFGAVEANLLYRSMPDVFDELGEPIRMEIILQNIHVFPRRAKVNAIYVDAVTGVGLNTDDDDADPKLMMAASRDGGVQFGVERQVSLGALAQRYVRIKERAWGNFDHNGMTLRLACTAKVARAIQGVTIDAEPLVS